MIDFTALLPAYTEMFMGASGLALLLFGVYSTKDSMRMVANLVFLTLVFSLLLELGHGHTREFALNNMFVVDRFAVYMKVVILFGSALAVLMSLDYLEREQMGKFEFPLLVLFAALGMNMMVAANDLMSLYIGLETYSLPQYVLASFRKNSLRSNEAGMKYFILGALSSGILLYGISFIYGYTGSTNYNVIGPVVRESASAMSIGMVVGVVFTVAGIAFKLGAAPFHMWAPDVYEGAPTPVTAFFAVAPKVAAFALLVRLLFGPLMYMFQQWQQLTIALGLASLIIGTLGAITQNNIKRFMAYSSIAHVGYLLIGIAAGTELSVRAVLIYTAIYVAMSVGAFGIILCMRQNGRMVEDIDHFAGLSQTHPALAMAMAVFMFSMAGVPPLGGFFGKFYVFMALAEVKMYWLAIAGVLVAVVGAYYYLRIIKVMYFDPPIGAFDKHDDVSMNVIIGITAFFNLAFFAYSGPVLQAATTAATSLYAH